MIFVFLFSYLFIYLPWLLLSFWRPFLFIQRVSSLDSSSVCRFPSQNLILVLPCPFYQTFLAHRAWRSPTAVHIHLWWFEYAIWVTPLSLLIHHSSVFYLSLKVFRYSVFNNNCFLLITSLQFVFQNRRPTTPNILPVWVMRSTI